MYEKIEIIRSKKSVLLNIDGYLYYKHSGDPQRRAYWICKKKESCGVRSITVVKNGIINVVKGPDDEDYEHINHAPNPEEVEAAKIVNNLKRAADQHPEEPPSRILRTELRNVPSG